MYQLISKLVIYKDFDQDCLLLRLAGLLKELENYDDGSAGESSWGKPMGSCPGEDGKGLKGSSLKEDESGFKGNTSKKDESGFKGNTSKEDESGFKGNTSKEDESGFWGNTLKKDEIISGIYGVIHDLLELATDYGFNQNLWHNYLAFLLITAENPFSITCEKTGAREGSVNRFARSDFKIFKALFDYDFRPAQEQLGIDCFSVITDYQAIEKSGSRYNRSVSEKVRFLSGRIEKAADENGIFDCVTEFYREYGVGMFGLNKAFRLKKEQGRLEIVPITNTREVLLSDLVGLELQKKKLVDNTAAFLEGRKANNVLLFGDSGTGKSTAVKAILNEYYKDGLRMIEIYKHQFEDLSAVIARVKNRNYKFIIYMDDLSFEEFEIEYKYLKAVIEGGLENRPDNVLIYATSNRRHLIRETWKDRSDMEATEELHRSDTMEEKLSLVARFGITINFSAPGQQEFYHIVTELAKRQELAIGEEELLAEANRWELSHGGRSGRTAQQFINYLSGRMPHR